MMTWKRKPAPRGRTISFTFEGREITTHEGETLAAALLAAGIAAFGATREGSARMPLCNMGTCFDCALVVDGQRLVRGCLTDVREGLCVTRNRAS
jgi:predicted molibdopterin-dependent oxidoreductase YjgC